MSNNTSEKVRTVQNFNLSVTQRNARVLLLNSLSVEETAELFGVTAGRIRQYLTDPEVINSLGAFQMPSGEWRIDKACAMKFRLTRNRKVGAKKKPPGVGKVAERRRQIEESKAAERAGFLGTAAAILNAKKAS